LAAMGVVQRQRLVQRVTFGIREGVPGPLRLRGEGKLLVAVRETLEPGGVGGEYESAVPHAEGRARIDRANYRRVPIHAGASVDCLPGGRRSGAAGERSG